MNINERIREIRKHFCGDKNLKFAEILKKEPNTTSNYVRNGYNVGRVVTSEIIAAFPEINAAWLLNEDGEMLNNRAVGASQSSDINAFPSHEAWEVIKNQAASLKAKDEQMGDMIAILKEQLKKSQDVRTLSHAASWVEEENE